jgi:hypothetical protein
MFLRFLLPNNTPSIRRCRFFDTARATCQRRIVDGDAGPFTPTLSQWDSHMEGLCKAIDSFGNTREHANGLKTFCFCILRVTGYSLADLIQGVHPEQIITNIGDMCRKKPD